MKLGYLLKNSKSKDDDEAKLSHRVDIFMLRVKVASIAKHMNIRIVK